MSNYINNINTYADLTAYNADTTKDYPNVSYIKATDEVKMIQYDPEYVVCKYNVTSTDSATKLLNSTYDITKQYIDGVEQQSVQATYTFSTMGEHTVKYAMTNIYTNAFQNCTNLTSVTIPNTITRVRSYAFEGCNSLVNIVVIPSSVTTINDSIFNHSSNPAIYFESTSPKTGYYNAFYNWDGIIYVPAESVETYKAATGWSGYAERVFSYPQQKGAEITFKMAKNASNINIFGNRLYAYFQNVYVNDVLQSSSKSITANTNDTVRCTLYDERMIPQYLNSYNYTNGYMKEIVLPSTIKSIPKETLYYTSNMVSITILATTPPVLGTDALRDSGNVPIYVPSASVDAYKAASGWSQYASRIQAIPTT